MVFSGCLGPLAIPLARRVATDAAVHDNGTAAVEDDPAAAATKAFFERAGCGPEGLAAWLAGRCDDVWFRELLCLESRDLRACADALSPDRCSAALESRRLDLMRIVFRTARFPTERQAREALLCITDDGESFTDTVHRAGAPAEEQSLLLEDAAQTLRAHLLSTARARPSLRRGRRANR